MDIHIHVEKKHVYILASLFVIVFGALLVRSTGSGDPSFHGHDQTELFVNGTSILDGSITNADVSTSAAISGSKVDASTLSGTAASLTAGAASVASNTGTCNAGGQCMVGGSGNGVVFYDTSGSCNSENVRILGGSCYLNIEAGNNGLRIDVLAGNGNFQAIGLKTVTGGGAARVLCIDSSDALWIDNDGTIDCV